MKRFDDVLDIILAYQKTKLRPVRKNFGDGINCGCPATVMAVAAGVKPGHLDVKAVPIYNRIGEQVSTFKPSKTSIFTDYLYTNYGEDYIDGFTSGVDNPQRCQEELDDQDTRKFLRTDGALGMQHGIEVTKYIPFTYGTGRNSN